MRPNQQSLEDADELVAAALKWQKANVADLQICPNPDVTRNIFAEQCDCVGWPGGPREGGARTIPFTRRRSPALAA